MITNMNSITDKIMPVNYARLLIILFLSGSLSASSLVFPPYGHSYGIRKATQAHLFMFLPFTKFKDPQGLATAKMESRDDPSTEHDDDEVVVYGVNSGNHQLIYNTSMWGLASYGKKGSGKGRFLFPKGIVCDPKGNVYVVDAGNNRIVHLFNPQKKVRWVKAFSGKKDGLKAPSQIALDAQGFIYVTDTGNRRIVVFNKKGDVVRRIVPKKPEVFIDGPTTLAVADGTFPSSYFKKERILFCADMNGERLWKIDLSGNVKKVIRISRGHHAFYGAVDYYHNFYVTDKEKHCIIKYDHTLKLLDIFGSHGKDDNQFIEPRGIAIWKRYGQTFVAEKGGAQYYWVGTSLKKAGFWEKEQTDSFYIRTIVPEYSYMSLLYIAGTDTTTLRTRTFIMPGEQTRSITDGAIRKLQGGSFIIRVEPTYSSYTYYHWDYPIALCRSEAAVPKKPPKGVFVKKKGEKGKRKSISELLREAKKKNRKE